MYLGRSNDGHASVALPMAFNGLNIAVPPMPAGAACVPDQPVRPIRRGGRQRRRQLTSAVALLTVLAPATIITQPQS